MPDFVTHHLFGSLVLNHKMLPNAVKSLCTRYPSAFCWGLQGPDPLYYHRVLLGGSDLNTAAREMHHLYTAQLLEEWAKLVLSAPLACKEELLAYFFGFLCHYASDAALHPYVYHLQDAFVASNPTLSKSGAHAYIESAIDTVLYRSTTGKDVTEYPFSKQYALSQGAKNIIGRSFHVILHDLYQKDIPIYMLEACFADTLRMQKIFYGDHALAAKAVKFGERLRKQQGAGSGHFKLKNELPDWDVLNEKHTLWQHPYTGRESFDSVPQVLAKAADHAVQLISTYESMVRAGNIRFVPMAYSFCGEPI